MILDDKTALDQIFEWMLEALTARAVRLPSIIESVLQNEATFADGVEMVLLVAKRPEYTQWYKHTTRANRITLYKRTKNRLLGGGVD